MVPMEKKNQVWLNRFRAGDYSRVLYAESNQAYFDLVVLEKMADGIPDYSAIPAPVLHEIIYESDLYNVSGDQLRNDIQEFLADFDLISRDQYDDLRLVRDVMIADKDLSDFSFEDRRILKEVKEFGLILDEVQNQDGEMIVTEEIFYDEGLFYHRTLACHGSSWLGLGTCQCVNHDWYDDLPVPAKKVLELAKSNVPA